MTNRLAVAALALFLVPGALACAPASGCGGATDGCLRILFVGNSYTQVNDLPGTFAALARAGGHRVEVAMAAEGGQTLEGHLTSSNTQRELSAGRWDVVVLQEQSVIPAVASSRDGSMAPAAKSLVDEVRGIGARAVLFSTWAHRNGAPEYGVDSEAAMQQAIDASYLTIGRQLGAGVIPVGEAWSAALALDPPVTLWQDDGSHPTAQGTFLAAAVFYAALFGDDPVAAAGGPGAPSMDASRALAGVARDVVANRGQWGLD
jgi:hypothetical protein